MSIQGIQPAAVKALQQAQQPQSAANATTAPAENRGPLPIDPTGERANQLQDFLDALGKQKAAELNVMPSAGVELPKAEIQPIDPIADRISSNFEFITGKKIGPKQLSRFLTRAKKDGPQHADLRTDEIIADLVKSATKGGKKPLVATEGPKKEVQQGIIREGLIEAYQSYFPGAPVPLEALSELASDAHRDPKNFNNVVLSWHRQAGREGQPTIVGTDYFPGVPGAHGNIPPGGGRDAAGTAPPFTVNPNEVLTRLNEIFSDAHPSLNRIPDDQILNALALATEGVQSEAELESRIRGMEKSWIKEYRDGGQ